MTEKYLKCKLNYFRKLNFNKDFDINKLSELLKSNNIKFYISGGVFTSIFSGNKINDVDIFFPDANNLNRTINLLRYYTDLLSENNIKDYLFIEDNGFVCNFKDTQNNIKIQLIKNRFYSNMESLLDDFDFTIVKFAYDGDDCFYHYKFFEHLSSRDLVTDDCLVENVSNVLSRCFRYIKRGFNISKVEMWKLIKQLNEEDIDWKDEHFQYCFYNEQLTNKEDDPF